MPVQMVAPTPHPKSGVYRVRLTVPPEMRDTARRLYGAGWELSESLRTKDKRAAIAAAPAALAKLNDRLATIKAAHSGIGRPLTHLEVHGVAGQWYLEQVKLHEADPGSAAAWEAERDRLLEPLEHEADDPVPEFLPGADDLAEAAAMLADSHNIAADERSVRAVAVALRARKIDLADLMVRRARGDYGPDDVAAAIPALPGVKAKAAAGGVTFDALLRGWALDAGIDPEARPIDRAYYDRLRTIERLAEFLGHRDAARVTKADAVRWKESIQSKGRTAATVRNDLSEMSAVWKAGQRNGKVTDNPFAGVLPPKPKRGHKNKIREFEDDEVVVVLQAARRERDAALRWLPWVACLTGARVSEICQSAKADIVWRAGHPFLRIHDDDTDRRPGEAKRSVKNVHSIRQVPIHPALVAEGFLKYVDSLPAGAPLFPGVKPDALFGKRGETGARMVRKWLRGLGITDRRISPNHSWRHWLIAKARRVGMPEEVRHSITGHVDGDNESHNYGSGYRDMPARQAEELAKITLPPGVALG